jgi:hypothetical protein
VKPVGKPDAGKPHVLFDERGRETERCRHGRRHRALPRLYHGAGGLAAKNTFGVLPIATGAAAEMRRALGTAGRCQSKLA